MPASRTTRTVARRGLSWALLALLAVAAVGVLQTSAGRSGLDALGATPAPAGYTEVAIVKAPKAVAHGRNLAVTFAITIHDVQAGGDYRWALVTTGAHAVGATPGGGLALGAGERRTVDVRATVRCDAGAKRTWVGARVDPEPAASVGTWLSCPGARP